MTTGAGYLGWGIVCGAAALAFVGCGDGSDSPPPPNDGGAGGEAGAPENGGAGQSWTEGGAGASASGAGGGGQGGGGEGGEASGPEPTFPLTAEDVSRIAGTSFTSPAAPTFGDCESSSSDGFSPELDYVQLAFVANGSGGVDVIASTRGPWLNLQRSRLLRGETGYVVETPAPTAGCMAYAGEDTYQPSWSIPTRLALDFTGKDGRGKATSMSVRALFVGEHGTKLLTATGVRDVSAPRIIERTPWVYLSSDDSYYRDERVGSWILPRRFELTEALKPGWSVALENEAGDRYVVATNDGVALTTGFDVVQFFPAGFHWVVTGEDFAGNDLEGGDYPSPLPPPEAGTFEGEGVWAECPSPDPSENCVAAAAPGHAGVTALAGARSLFVVESRVSLRVARVSGASKLVFRVRALGAVGSNEPSVSSTIQALDAGSSASVVAQTGGFETDSEQSNAQARVSKVRDVSLVLPPGQGDVMVTLESDDSLWLDSVHTE